MLRKRVNALNGLGILQKVLEFLKTGFQSFYSACVSFRKRARVISIAGTCAAGSCCAKRTSASCGFRRASKGVSPFKPALNFRIWGGSCSTLFDFSSSPQLVVPLPRSTTVSHPGSPLGVILSTVCYAIWVAVVMLDSQLSPRCVDRSGQDVMRGLNAWLGYREERPNVEIAGWQLKVRTLLHLFLLLHTAWRL